MKRKHNASRLPPARQTHAGDSTRPATPMLFTREGQGVWLDNMYRGRTAFLLCGGPSLVSHNLRLLEQRGVLTCAVNNSATVFRPHLWVSVDASAHFCDVIWRDPGILKFIPAKQMEKHFAVRDENDQLQPSQEVVGDMPAVFGFRQNKEFVAERWLYEDTFNWGNHVQRTDAQGYTGSRSVMYVALRLLFHLGIRRLYLLGCDFRMRVGRANYAFAQHRTASSVRGNNAIYHILNARLAQLQPYFQKEGYQIFNCTPNSGLAVFPYESFERAVEIACAHMPRRIITDGMYDQQAARRAKQDAKTGVSTASTLEKGPAP